jgi:hypothetical protein
MRARFQNSHAAMTTGESPAKKPNQSCHVCTASGSTSFASARVEARGRDVEVRA